MLKGVYRSRLSHVEWEEVLLESNTIVGSPHLSSSPCCRLLNWHLPTHCVWNRDAFSLRSGRYSLQLGFFWIKSMMWIGHQKIHNRSNIIIFYTQYLIMHFQSVGYCAIWMWNLVSYIKWRIQAKGIWKQDREANIWAQEGWEWGVEKAPQWGTS